MNHLVREQFMFHVERILFDLATSTNTMPILEPTSVARGKKGGKECIG